MAGLIFCFIDTMYHSTAVNGGAQMYFVMNEYTPTSLPSLTGYAGAHSKKRNVVVTKVVIIA